MAERVSDATETELIRGVGLQRTVRRFRIIGVEGPADGKTAESASDRCTIGSDAANDLVIDDPSVSRFHCEIGIDDRGPRLIDLGSTNGTIVDGMMVADGWLRSGAVIRLGRSAVRFELGADANRVPIATEPRFGSLIGVSVPMRATFAVMARAAASDATILIEGETGTGKEGTAESIHRASGRRDAPFLVIDCSAIPAHLLESELFGHERGAFTGAIARRTGIFEEADGGTVFLDEIGELAPDLQPKLLRVLEKREVRRVGANAPTAIDVRVVAATNRDLRAEVNANRFRGDLYFRLAVVKIQLPPLRHRPEDIPVLAEHIVRQLDGEDAARRLLTPEFLAEIKRATWRGNVRELRNYLERCLVLDAAQPLADTDDAPATSPPIDASLPYAEAKRRLLDDFERRYLEALIRRHDGNVSAAARAADMDRVYLHKLLGRHGIRR